MISAKNTRQILSATWKNFLLPLLPAVIAIMGILGSVCIQHINNENESKIKQYEVTFNEKQQDYASFMMNLKLAFVNASLSDCTSTINNINSLEITSYRIEPFLDDITRDYFHNEVLNVSNYTLENCKGQHTEDERNMIYDNGGLYVAKFRDSLYPNLFRDWNFYNFNSDSESTKK